MAFSITNHYVVYKLVKFTSRVNFEFFCTEHDKIHSGEFVLEGVCKINPNNYIKSVRYNGIFNILTKSNCELR